MAEAAATGATGQSQMCWQRLGNQMEEPGEESQVIGVEKGTGDKLLSQYQTNQRFHKFD
jgi:hypothetical protein